MESTAYFETDTNGIEGLGRQPQALAVLRDFIAATHARLNGLAQALEIAGPEGRDVIQAHIREAFRDLEAAFVLAELLGA